MVSPSRAAERIDSLLAEVAAQFRALPRCPELTLLFRECLSAHGLAGGYARAGKVARPLSESLKGIQCR